MAKYSHKGPEISGKAAKRLVESLEHPKPDPEKRKQAKKAFEFHRKVTQR